MLSGSGLTFGCGDAPEASRPGVHPESFEDFRHEPDLRKSLSGLSSEEAYAQWLVHAKYVAQRAKLAADSGGRSAAALARLAHAYLAADELYRAVPAATEALDVLVDRMALAQGDEQASSLDVPAAVAAAWALVVSHQSGLAEARLSKLPPSLPVILLRAVIAADAGRLPDAVELLAKVESPDADCLRGYVLLRLNRPEEAIHELRKAIAAGKKDADACANMAEAFWRVGSRRKAINFARQASQLAHGRKDISLALIDYLINSDHLVAAEVEIQAVLSSGVEDEPELVLRRARIKALRGDVSRALALLRRTENMAKASDDLNLANFATGQRIMLEVEAKRTDRAEAIRRIRGLVREFPKDVSLATTFAWLCRRSTMLKELQTIYSAHKDMASRAQLRYMEMRIAYLAGSYEELARMARDWSREEPLNSTAADLAMLWTAFVSLDWAAAARSGASLLQRFPGDGSLANNIAYVSVLAGKPNLAERALKGIESKSQMTEYVVLATRGLIELAKGEIQEGLRNYRRAAELAEEEDDGQVERAEVIVAQGFALRLIGAYDEVSSAVRAGALPAVSLPTNWKDVPQLLTIQWLCERTGCEWPPFIA